MLRHKHIDRVCCVVLALTVLLSAVFIGAADAGFIAADNTLGYEDKLFDQSRVHTLDIRMDDWEAFLDTCTSETYSPCDVVIDGEKYTNVAIRGKGNTSLSSVAGFGNDRYSFKIEFDRYQSGMTYHGLDKLSLNNLIYDHTYMKDYWSYTLMNKMGVASSLCSFVQITVNGENWGLYLAVEGVEESFLQRNYGSDYGDLYKPDSMNFGGGRGNGRDFDMAEFSEENGFPFGGGEEGEMPSPPADGDGFDGSFGGSSGAPAQPGSEGGSSGGQSSAPTAMPAPTATPAPTAAPTAQPENTGSASGGESAGSQGGQMPEGNLPPDMGDFAGSDGGQMPQGGMPEGGMPAGTPPTGDGFAPSNGEAAPAPGTVPETSSAPEQSAAPVMPNGQMPDMSGLQPGDERPAAPDGASFEMPGGFGGGPGGMSGSDVKLQYIDDDPESYSNIFSSAKTPVTQADQTRLIAALKALSEGDTSAVDTDAVIRYMAVHNFLVNDDSYTGMMVHNYYLYEKDGKLAMIPWDYNLAFGGMSATSANSAVNTPIDDLVSSMGGFGSSGGSDRPMAAWIMNSEEAMAQYHAFYQTFMDEVFNSGWFEEEFDRVTAMIDPYVKNDREPFCTYEEYQTASATLRAFCLRRAESICGQLDGSIPATSAGQRNSTALVDASDLDVSAMGSMNGGGFGGPGGGERPGRTERTDRPDASENPVPTRSVQPAGSGDENSRPTGDFGGFPGMNVQTQSQTTQQEKQNWLIGCTALLIVAVGIVMCKKSWQ